MNKIFKVIYSKTRHCYIVVSELAKSHCKTTQSHTVRSKTALTAAVLLALGAFLFVGMPSVQAESLYSNDYVGTNYKDDNGKSYSSSETKNYHGGGARGVGSNTLGMNAIAGKNTITIGDRDASAATESVYIGAKYDANNQVHPSSGNNVVSVGYGSDAAGTGSIAIGSGAAADAFDNAGEGKNPDKESQSIAIGNNAVAKQNNIAIGAGSVATAKASTADAYLTGQAAVSSYVSVGGGTVTTTDPKTQKKTTTTTLRRLTNVADGAADSDAATIAQLKEAVKETDASKKANINASNIGKNLKKTDGTTVADAADITNNENAWGEAIGTGSIADPTKSEKNDPAKNGSQQLVTGGTVYNALQQQKTDLTNDLSVNAGWGINIAKTKDNKIISLDRNLGKDLDTSRNNVTVNDTGLILGGVNNVDDGSLASYGATGEYAVTVGGSNAYASGTASIAVGGSDNTASGENATVSGGTGNTAVGGVSAVYGGWANTAFGTRTAIMGGRNNDAFGDDSVANGGQANIAYGSTSTVVGGFHNFVGGDTATSIGGWYGVVNGAHSVGILGGSTSIYAPYTLAAGYHSVVTGTGLSSRDVTEKDYEELSQGKLPASGIIMGDKVVDNFATAIGDKATADAPQTISFGHDKGDVSGYKIIWKERADGKVNPDGTSIDYQNFSIQETTYDSAYYNRLVKAADGIEDHDAVVMEQLKNASDVGSNIKVYKTDNGNVQFDENNKPIEDTSDAAKTKREAAQKASEDAWGEAIGTGKVEANNFQLVTGDTVYNAIQNQAEWKLTTNGESADKAAAIKPGTMVNFSAEKNGKDHSNIPLTVIT